MEMQPSLSQPSNNHRKKSASGDSFSFPSTPNQEESDFEFGSLTPDSPSCTTSPADHLFFNGRLQPHSFPLSHCSFQQQQQQQHYAVATTSRTSSIGSKDSLLSSRSNSTNSSCSSARTSSSDSSERRFFHNVVSGRHIHHNRGALGCSQRWQYITPVPALNRDVSKRRRATQKGTKREEKKQLKKKKKQKDTLRGVPLRFGRKLFRWFFTACRQCHAMEPSKAHKETVDCKKL